VEELAGGDPRGSVELIRYEPERVELAVREQKPSLLVLNDAYYSGWSATVDGTPSRILPANGAVRGVVVPGGAHTVTFVYKTPGLALGGWLSVLAGMAVAAALFLKGYGL
jgi:uncharacterized membrane protein YfhO